MTWSLAVWWTLSLVVAFFAGILLGWCVPYVSTALRFGAGIVEAFRHAGREMNKDAEAMRIVTDDVIDVTEE